MSVRRLPRDSQVRTERLARVVLGKKKFYYNLKTGEVEEGRQSSWTDLMGPYPTRDAAEHALEIARGRTQEWDAGQGWGAGTSRDDGKGRDED